ncbi:MAG: ABC transporter permease subunit [Bacteriovoracia bacterium]
MIAPAVKHLFWKEFKSYFNNPLGYVFLFIFLFGIGYVTFELGRGSFFYLRQATLTPMFRYIPWMFLLFIPAVSMKLWAEERKSGTIEILFTMPITVGQAVVAKFLAAWAFIGLALVGTFPMIITVVYLGNPDPGPIFMGYLASFIMGGTLIAIGSFFSALTKNQVVSFILTIVVTLFFLMAGSPPVINFVGNFFPQYFLELFESLNMLNHFEALERGVMSFGHIWYFIIMMCCWLFGNVILLQENKSK